MIGAGRVRLGRWDSQPSAETKIAIYSIRSVCPWGLNALNQRMGSTSVFRSRLGDWETDIGVRKAKPYLEKELTRSVDSLNDEPVRSFYAREHPAHQLTLYRRIKGNWYPYRD